MPNYKVYAAADAVVSAVTIVIAKDETEARAKAQEHFDSGDADWKYEGLIDGTVVVVGKQWRLYD